MSSELRVDEVSAVLADLLGGDAVRAMDDDLVGAMAYAITALRNAPVEQRMKAMGMRPMVDPESGTADYGWWEEVPDGPTCPTSLDGHPHGCRCRD